MPLPRTINHEREFFRMVGDFLACQEELNSGVSRFVGAFDRDTPGGKSTEEMIWMGLLDSTAEMYYILKAWREELHETDNRTEKH